MRSMASVYFEKLRLWWLTRKLVAGIAAVFQSSPGSFGTKFPPKFHLPLDLPSRLFFIPAITLLQFYRPQLATNIFLVSFG